MCHGATTTDQELPEAEEPSAQAIPSPLDVDSSGEGTKMCDQHTEELFAELREAKDLATYLSSHDLGAQSLSSYLNEKLNEKGLRRSEVLREAQIEQTFGWYVFNGKRGMGRDNVIKLCLVMGLDARETNRALQAAGANALYPKVRCDAIIVWCLEHGLGLQRTNEVLYAFGENCLE